MGLWENLTECERTCCFLHRNGFKQVEIGILNIRSADTISSHLHSAKRKGKCHTIIEVIGDLIHEGQLPKLHPDDRQILQDRIDAYIKKYGKPKNKEIPKRDDAQVGTLNKKTA